MGADPLDDLVGLFHGAEAEALYDEQVTELDHALQAAALARSDGATDADVAAALLHDVGHLVIGDLVSIDVELYGDHHHERAGARYLRRWFGPAVTEPVRLHVAAKRYLCATEPQYRDALSPSSIRSLAVQGGAMSADEVAGFEAEPGWRAAVRVRRWDDRAKVAGADVPAFDTYRSLLESLVERAGPLPDPSTGGVRSDQTEEHP